MEEMYRENIMDHYKNPRNFGKLKNATIEFKDYNPICGDEITIQIEIEDNKVKDVKFIGKGCALSMATASILTDELKGKPVKEIEKLSKEDILKMVGIEVSPSRIKCVMLSLSAIKKGVKLNDIKNWKLESWNWC